MAMLKKEVARLRSEIKNQSQNHHELRQELATTHKGKLNQIRKKHAAAVNALEGAMLLKAQEAKRSKLDALDAWAEVYALRVQSDVAREQFEQDHARILGVQKDAFDRRLASVQHDLGGTISQLEEKMAAAQRSRVQVAQQGRDAHLATIASLEDELRYVQDAAAEEQALKEKVHESARGILKKKLEAARSMFQQDRKRILDGVKKDRDMFEEVSYCEAFSL